MRQPAARITKMHVCPTVLVCRPPAARLGEPSVHGGTIVLGAPTVFVGG